jgi:hypothetical protein
MVDESKEVLVIDKDTLTMLLDKILGEMAAQRAQDHEELMAFGAATNTLLTAALEAGIDLAKSASGQHIAADVASMAASDTLSGVSETNRHAERMYELETERQEVTLQNQPSPDPDGIAGRLDALEELDHNQGERIESVTKELDKLKARVGRHHFGTDD